MTGIHVEHFVVVDFGSFGKMVDAVDGVQVCVPEDIVDRKHQIFVPKGDPSTLTGDEALDYVRARYVGEKIQQNDISRIRRQQEFIGALVRQVKSAGTLTRVDKVVKFLDAATSALTTDDEFDDVTQDRPGRDAAAEHRSRQGEVRDAADRLLPGRRPRVQRQGVLDRAGRRDLEAPHPRQGAAGEAHRRYVGQRRGPARDVGVTDRRGASRRRAVESPSETPSETPTETAPHRAPTETPSDARDQHVRRRSPIFGVCA